MLGWRTYSPYEGNLVLLRQRRNLFRVEEKSGFGRGEIRLWWRRNLASADESSFYRCRFGL